jgi:integrase
MWLVMMTGMRRAELTGLRWRHVGLDAGTLKISPNWLRPADPDIDKDTKTHQSRALTVDNATVEVLAVLVSQRLFDRRFTGELAQDHTDCHSRIADARHATHPQPVRGFESLRFRQPNHPTNTGAGHDDHLLVIRTQVERST